jgi:hypothetical protein
MCTMNQFQSDELTINTAFPSSRIYMPQGSDLGYNTNHNVHDGQRKLLLSEIEFLTEVLSRRCDSSTTTHRSLPNLLCVYAGACPCTHLKKVLHMFPNVSWVLVDPRFKEGKYLTNWDKRRVAVCAHNFNDATAQEISSWVQGGGKSNSRMLPSLQGLDWDPNCGFQNLLFVSDIRSDSHNEVSIESDMENQARWFKLLHASAGLLKFRLPYCDERWYSEYLKHRGFTSYLDGTIHLPIWGPPSTSECRLHVQIGGGVKQYDVYKHEMRMAGFEADDRKRSYVFENKLYSSFDRAAEACTMHAYVRCMKDYA